MALWNHHNIKGSSAPALPPYNVMAEMSFTDIIMGEHPKEDADNLLLLEPKTDVKRPPMFKVIMHNDDYTPMDFVVKMLKNIFRLQHEDAINVMLQIHHQERGICGVFTRDVAETKIELVLAQARSEGHPLQCSLEEES